jgi:uncharacterized protein YqeY
MVINKEFIMNITECPMTIIGLLDTYIAQAMKDGDKDMLAIYRIAKTEMIKQQKDKGIVESLIDHESVFKTMKKRLLEEIEALEKAGRDTTVQQKQLAWIVSELPKPVTEEEIRLDLCSWLPEQPDNCKNMGFIMQHLKLMFHGRTLDGKLASTIAKEMLDK